MARLFTALVPPSTVQEELAALAEKLDDVRWNPPQNIHLTLRFLGEVDDARLTKFEESLGRVRVEPFVLPVGGIGVFPPRGPAKVLWAGVENGHTRLYQLRKQVDDALISVDLSLDVRTFHPHFTLARIGENHDPKKLAQFLERHAKLEAPPFRVDAFALVASRLEPGRPPAYSVVRNYPLSR